MSHSKHVEALETVTERCHVCHSDFNDEDHVVIHIGHTGAWSELPGIAAKNGRIASFHEGDGSITMHSECATILAMRLIHDVVAMNGSRDHPPVTTALRRLREAYQMKG